MVASFCMSGNDCELQQTADGSSTLYSERFGESYHSMRGALTESRHVFVANGVASCAFTPPIHILEYGFGLGVNLLATLEWSLRTGNGFKYTTLEQYPVAADIVRGAFFVTDPEVLYLWSAAHEAPWGVEVSLSPQISITKLQVDFLEYHAPEHSFHIVYFDAFSPSHVPEQWSADIFTDVRRALVDGGAVVTYSAAGIVKRTLRDIGFAVQRLPGALGKHHMLRAEVRYSSGI